ncbi:type III PLP-dependent enzyme domain-containing protein [Chromobacterium vaccinii]|uniref:hypothetical protein n=1 Tax=Chromobacterium vaccinii TaxID=1108595 RepID=UPI0011C04A52|nr:hypothetical protein [Chromobacterium vaccinii]
MIGLRLHWEQFYSSKLQSRFGLDFPSKYCIEQLIKIGLKGLHIHSSNEKSIVDYTNISKKIISEYGNLLDSLSYINFGGSLPKNSIDMIDGIFEAIRKILPAHIQIQIEPGALFWGGAITLATKVVSTNFYHDKNIHLITLDASQECHLKWSKGRLILNKKELGGKNLQNVIFGGATCYEQDIIGAYQIPSNLLPEVGDVIFFENISSYSLAWNTEFNGIQKSSVEII